MKTHVYLCVIVSHWFCLPGESWLIHLLSRWAPSNHTSPKSWALSLAGCSGNGADPQIREISSIRGIQAAIAGGEPHGTKEKDAGRLWNRPTPAENQKWSTPVPLPPGIEFSQHLNELGRGLSQVRAQTWWHLDFDPQDPLKLCPTETAR